MYYACAFIALSLLGHADKNDPSLWTHFAVGVHPLDPTSCRDLTGHLSARIDGSPTVRRRGPTDCLDFAPSDRFILGPATQSPPTDPSQGFTVQAWICIDEPATSGTVLHQPIDQSRQEAWQLGFDRHHWTFDLGSPASRDRCELKSVSLIRKQGWHHVAAATDGRQVALFVDGQLEAKSTLSTDRPPTMPADQFIIGGGQTPTSTGFDGALFEAKIHHRRVPDQELMLVALKNRNLLAWNPDDEAELTFVVKPMLQFATGDSITIVCETNRPTKVQVKYAPNALLNANASSDQFAEISTVTVTGLKPTLTYFYRVECTDEAGQQVTSEIRSFKAAPSADTPWAFAILGDTQRNPDVTRKCAEGAFSCRPNFLMHCGDLVDDGFAKNQWLNDLFDPISELTSYVPIFPVIGNHERDAHWYYDYFHLPKPEYYYTFHFGNAQFFMLDSNRPLTVGSDQYQWLERELSQSKAEWKFACHHHPCFSSDNDDYGDHLRGTSFGIYGFGDSNARQAVALYEKHGVDIAFNGHIHVYERTWPILNMKVNLKNGVRYITSGGGGGHLESPAPQRTWFSLHVNKAYHYCHAAVAGNTMVFKAYDIEGRLFDTFELVKDAD